MQQIKIKNSNSTLSKKLGKACNTTLTINTLLQNINNDLIKANERKKNKAKREQKYYDEGQIMNLKIIQEKKAIYVNQQHKTFIRDWSHLDFDLFEDIKRDKSSVKKIILPFTPDSLILFTSLAFRVSSQPEKERSPSL